MRVDDISKVNFGYHTHIKDCWLAGKLPTVTKGLYGIPLTKKTVSNEHIIPVAEGGKTEQGNIALANKYINNLRGTKPIKEFLTRTQLNKYLEQFIDVVVEYKGKIFRGNDYIRDIEKTSEKLDLQA